MFQPIPGIGKDDFPRTGRAAVGLFDAGNEAGKNGVPVLGDIDSIELVEGQDLPQRSHGINRGDGGGGKALLVVGQARRLEGQQVIDGDVVIPGVCKTVSGLFLIGDLLEQCQNLRTPETAKAGEGT